MTTPRFAGGRRDNGRARPSRRSKISVGLAALTGMLLLAIAPVAAAKGKPAEAGGPKPSGTQILPRNLGPTPECPRTYGNGLNSGDTAGLYVVGTGNCANPGNQGAVRWTESLGMQYLGLLPGSSGSVGSGVSEDGTVVGSTGGSIGQAFVLEPGATALQRLVPFSGYVHATADGISANGRYIAGTSSTETVSHMVVWEKDSATNAWKPRDLGAAMWEGPRAISDDGTAILNTTNGPWNEISSDYTAWVVESTGTRVQLPGEDTYAHDIDYAGDLVVGFDRAACVSGNCVKYPVPVYWSRTAAGWNGPVALTALDGVDSEARGVAVMADGRRLIAGHGFTKKDGIMRAVAWVETQAGSGQFTLYRLGAIGGRGKAWAWAGDVNTHGQVAGTSQASGLDKFAVLWQLPVP